MVHVSRFMSTPFAWFKLTDNNWGVRETAMNAESHPYGIFEEHPLRVAVVDDEDLPREYLVKVLREMGIDVIAECADAEDAVIKIEQLTPDIAFLDICMPGQSGLEVAEALAESVHPPLLIFVTAFPSYAVESMKHQPFDYLLKPIDITGLSRTINRAQRMIMRRRSQEKIAILQGPNSPIQMFGRLPLWTKNSIPMLKLNSIECAVTRNRQVILRYDGEDQRVSYSLIQLESLLPNCEFMRIHSSVLVRLDSIESFNYLGNRSYSVTLRSGLTLPVGRNFYIRLKARLGIQKELASP